MLALDSTQTPVPGNRLVPEGNMLPFVGTAGVLQQDRPQRAVQ
jgi:hypothetical protein